MALNIKRHGWVTDDRIRTRMNILGASLAKTDRILTGRRDITVRMLTQRETGLRVPGFSDGQNITIHRDAFQNIGDAITLVKIMGLNYHELSHIIMTPRNTTVFRKAVMAEKMGYAFNALEDQRIETHFVATYRAAAKYFTEMVIEFYVNKPEGWPLAHLLTHGRRFLPLEIREAFKSRFVLSGTADEKRMEEIVDEYRLLDLSDVDQDTSLTTRAMSLIREYHKILQRAQNAAQQDLPNPFGADDSGKQGCGSQDHGTTDRQQARQAKARAEEQAQDQDEQEESGEDGSGFWDDVKEDEDDEEEDGSASGDEEEGDEEDGEEGSGEGEDLADDDSDDDGDTGQDGDADDSDDESDEAGSEEGDGGSANSGGDDSEDDSDGDLTDDDSNEHGSGGSASSDEEIEEILNDILRGVMQSEQVQGDVRQMQNAINDPDAFDLDERIRPNTRFNASPQWVSASTRVERELRRLFAQVEPGWKYGSDTGRLNVNRAMTSEDYEDVFDEWDEGREHDTGIEAVIAIDTSGSMMGQEIHDACVAMWIIKRALDAVNASVSVMSFDVVTKTLFGRHDKVEKSSVPFWNADGDDTCPAQSIRNGRRILTQSDKPNKVFFIITDGGWNSLNPEQAAATGRQAYEDIPALVKSLPGTSVFIGIGAGGSGNANSQHFDIAANVDHADHIAPVMKAVVTNMLRTAVSKGGRR